MTYGLLRFYHRVPAKTMSRSALSTLERAISDVGCWSWWTGDPAKSLQLEFSGAQLWFPPTIVGEAPSGQIALRFLRPSTVVFLSRGDRPELSDAQWPNRFQADQLGTFNVGHDTFTMTNVSLAESLISQSTRNIPLVGELPSRIEAALASAPCWIAFWAGPVGALVIAPELEIVSHHGLVSLEEIDSIHAQWWRYWREYWKRKDSSSPLPRDYACEVTIPGAIE